MPDDHAASERVPAEEVERHAERIRAAFPDLHYRDLLKMLDDRELVPNKIMLAYNEEPLHSGEFGLCMPLGPDAEEGYVLYLHPHFRGREADVPLLLAYQLVVAIWGQERVTHEEAELFGATLFGLAVDTYYERVCRLADELPAADASAPSDDA